MPGNAAACASGLPSLPLAAAEAIGSLSKTGAWRLTIRSFVDGAVVSTAGYVKLLLPPRQSRGNSHWGLVARFLELEIASTG